MQVILKQLKKLVIKDKVGFQKVFGADSFLEYWPELLTAGVEVGYSPDWEGCYYILNERGQCVTRQALVAHDGFSARYGFFC